jgi:nucleoside-diphosphate-sugar epimerase
VGQALIPVLIQKYGKESVIGTDMVKPSDKFPCKFLTLNIMHDKKFEKIVHDNKVNTIIHYAAILSAAGEKPNGFEKAKEINIRGLETVFDIALKHKCM